MHMDLFPVQTFGQTFKMCTAISIVACIDRHFGSPPLPSYKNRRAYLKTPLMKKSLTAR